MPFVYAGRYGPDGFTDEDGNPRPNLTVAVRLAGTTTPAALYTDQTKTTQILNPTSTDANGNLSFWADPGLYDLLASGTLLTSVLIPLNPAEDTGQAESARLTQLSELTPDEGDFIQEVGGAWTAIPASGITSSLGLGVRQEIGDADVAVDEGTRHLALTTALTADRTVTLPDAVLVPETAEIVFYDEVAGVTPTNTLIFEAAGTDTIPNGTTDAVTFTTTGGWIAFRTDGTAWAYRTGTLGVSTDGTFTANSDSLTATEKATKTYIAATSEPLGTAVLKTLFDANTVLAATADNTPAALTVAASRIVGRAAAGDIAALTGAQVLALATAADLAIADGGGLITATDVEGALAEIQTAAIVNALAIAAKLDSSGWFTTTGWTRTGNHTFTVAGNLTTTYTPGTKVRFTDTTVKYGVIGSSSHSAGTTTVTLITNTTYSMSLDPTVMAYSYSENPAGHPDWFAYTPTFTGFSADPTGLINRWSAHGRTMMVQIGQGTAGTSNATTFTCTIPVTASANQALFGGANAFAVNNGATLTVASGWSILAAGTTVNFFTDMSLGGAWTASSTKRVRAILTYEF